MPRTPFKPRCSSAIIPTHAELETTRRNYINMQNELRSANEKLRISQKVSFDLKVALRETVIEKQKLECELSKSQNLNIQLAKQFQIERTDYYNKLNLLENELKNIKLSLDITKTKLNTANTILRENIRTGSKTQLRLSMMFLKMKATKWTIEKRRQLFEKLCYQFAEYMKEQADFLTMVAESKFRGYEPSENQNHFLRLMKRCSNLLYENAALRVQLELKKMNKNCKNTPNTPSSSLSSTDSSINGKNNSNFYSIEDRRYSMDNIVEHFESMTSVFPLSNNNIYDSVMSLNESEITLFKTISDNTSSESNNF